MINKLDGSGFNEAEDVKRLSIAAFICGMALESDLFLADSERDKLTELKNRFGFQRIRRAVEKSVCCYDKQEIRVTMSFGCANFDPEHSVEENIQVADRRLYRAKEGGRNRVVAEDE